MKKIKIAIEIGRDIRTRSFFRRDIEQLIGHKKDDIVLDFQNVEFISRSVADEICNLLQDYPSIKVDGMSGDVEKMYKIVQDGRNKPRVYPEMNAKVYHLKNMKELTEFFCAF